MRVKKDENGIIECASDLCEIYMECHHYDYCKKVEEYQSRDYCKDIKCFAEIGNYNKEVECKVRCGAYKFHKWLKNNEYKILKF